MNMYKNGRAATQFDQIVGISEGLAFATSPVRGRIIAGTVQIDPAKAGETTPPGTGLVHVQVAGAMESHVVKLCECFHAEDAYLAMHPPTSTAP